MQHYSFESRFQHLAPSPPSYFSLAPFCSTEQGCTGKSGRWPNLAGREPHRLRWWRGGMAGPQLHMGVAVACRRRPEAGQPRVPAANWPHWPRRATAALPAVRRDPGRSVGGATRQRTAVAMAAQPGAASGGRPHARRLHGGGSAIAATARRFQPRQAQ